MSKEEIIKIIKGHAYNGSIELGGDFVPNSEYEAVSVDIINLFSKQSSEKDKEILRLRDYNFQLTENRDLMSREKDRYMKLWIESNQKLKEAVVAINSMIYESNGALFVGINGDSPVPNKVYEFLTKLKQ